MNTFRVLLRYRLHELCNYSREPQQLLPGLPPVAVAIAIFYFLHRLLIANPGYAPLILASGVLLVLVLGLPAGLASLFASRENSLLLAAPVAFPVFLAARYLDRLSWDLEFALPVGLAAALALGSVHGCLPVLLLLLLGMAAAGILSCLLVILAVYYCGAQSLPALLLVDMVVLALPLLFFKHLAGLVVTPQLLWMANLMVLAVLALLLLLVTVGGSRLGSLYFMALARMRSGRRYGSRLAGRLGYRLLGLLHGPAGVLMAKDYLLHVRTPMQWVRIALLIVATGLYALFKARLLPQGLPAIPFLDVAVVLVLVHFMTGEVSVAAFAAETNRIGLLLAAPVGILQIVLTKYVTYGAPALVMGLSCLVFLDARSGAGAERMLISVLTGVGMLFGVTAVLVGLGAAGALPDKETEGYIDQLMIEQTPASSPRALLAYGIGTIVMIFDVAAIAICRIGPEISQGFVLVPAIACLNLILGLASLLFAARWIERRLGAL